MRWPIKYQFAVPMALAMLLGVATASGMNAWIAARSTRQRIEDQIQNAATIVKATNFPLTDSVLRQLRGLSGADFVVEDSQGRIRGSSAETFASFKSPVVRLEANRQRMQLTDPIRVGARDYFHGWLALPPTRSVAEASTLHILYPVAEYRKAWQAAVFPSLGVLVVALPGVVILAWATASRISRRTTRLREQLQRVAEGDYQPLPLPRRNDELRDLAAGVNHMATTLGAYEQTVRESERMQTLTQLGGALAHQLRNAVTGCRMALDLHADDCPLQDRDESLRVASRQLALMEEYVRRFLQIGKGPEPTDLEPVDLGAVVHDLLPLVQPTARHAKVRIEWQPPAWPAIVRGNKAALSQLLINLILNGIEAAVSPLPKNGATAKVWVDIHRWEPNQLRLCVSDSGPGPAANIEGRLFDPFVSNKRDGVGLGLAVVRAIAREHDAHLSWQRAEGRTQFRIDFSLEPSEASRGGTAGS